MKRIFFCIMIIAGLSPGQVFASGAASMVEKGNRLYKSQKYEDALKLYGEALTKEPDSAALNFNTGTAQYKTKDFQNATTSFEKSLATEDKGIEADANYNLGNTKYMLGLSKEDADLSGT